MLRKDYIMRQFEEFGKFLALLMGHKNNSNWSELEKQINENALKFTGTEIGAVEKLKDQVFIHELTEVKQLNEGQLKMLGDLLYEKGIAYTQLFKEDEAKNAFTKALSIYNHIRSNALETDFSLDMHFKIKAIQQLLNG